MVAVETIGPIVIIEGFVIIIRASVINVVIIKTFLLAVVIVETIGLVIIIVKTIVSV